MGTCRGRHEAGRRRDAAGTARRALAALLTCLVLLGVAAETPLDGGADGAVEVADEAAGEAPDVRSGAETGAEAAPVQSGESEVYELVAPGGGDVICTTSRRERDALALAGWTYEGVAWVAPALSSLPVWRLRQPDGTHRFTGSASERAQLLAAGWDDEGVAWYSDENRSVPVLRDCGKEACRFAAAVGDPTVGDALWWALGGRASRVPEHPMTIFEGVDYAPVYDYAQYLSANPQVGALCGNDDAAALRHYVLTGLASGLSAKDGVDEATVEGYALKRVGARVAGVLGSASGSGIYPIGGYRLDEDIEAGLERGIAAVGADCAFVMVDLVSGEGVAYNIDEEFYSASTLKGPYMASIARYADAYGAHGDMVDAVLRYSDNDAYAALFDMYGPSYMRRWYEESGATSSDVEWRYANISARNLALMWASMADWFSNDERGARFGGLYENPYVSPIHSVLGGRYVTRTKAGWYADRPIAPVVNDSGIVYVGSRPYLMTVMTNVSGYQFNRLSTLVAALDAAHGRR